MSRFRANPEIRRTTEQAFRSCGEFRRECVVAWIAKLSAPLEVTRVKHLPHASSAVMTEIDPAALYTFNLELMSQEECVVAQLHTHPGAAFHSARDDAFPITHSAGLISLVIPRFGQDGLAGMRGCFAAEYLGAGLWRTLPEQELVELVSWSGE